MRLAAVGLLLVGGTLPGRPVASAAPLPGLPHPAPIDPARLPRAAAPVPPQPTVQAGICTVPGYTAPTADAVSQLDGLGLPAAWALSRGTGQRVAVIDTGVAPHRRLPGLIGGGDYVGGGDGTRDCDGHGTLVAGIIAAAPDPAAGPFTGVAPAATVIAIRQSSTRFAPAGEFAGGISRGGGRGQVGGLGIGDVDTLAAAVRTAADLGASVINISAVACAAPGVGLDDRALGAALAYAVDRRDAVVVAAAGNSGEEGTCPPGLHGPPALSPPWYDDYVLTVGSVDRHGAPSSFTLVSPWVDVAAPGEAVCSLGPVGDALADTSDGGTPLAGTSYAAPVVAGLAALLRSRFPGWSARQVIARIVATAHHPPGGHDDAVGAGVIDPVTALSADAAPPGSSPTPATPPHRPVATPTAPVVAPAPVTPSAGVPAPPAPAAAPAAIAGTGVALRGSAALLVLLALAVAAAIRRARRR